MQTIEQLIPSSQPGDWTLAQLQAAFAPFYSGNSQAGGTAMSKVWRFAALPPDLVWDCTCIRKITHRTCHW